MITPEELMDLVSHRSLAAADARYTEIAHRALSATAGAFATNDRVRAPTPA
jgi:hypothetical protein